MKTENCADKVQEAYQSRMEDIKTMYYADNQETPELGKLSEYGLCIDYVEAGTFNEQPQGYKRYQLSWGGPQEEFRLYDDGNMEFWYLDWFDGASVPVTGQEARIIESIFEDADL